jgi:CarboxypepD_reg-like domain/TonB-dependent Receptor Plug Domain
MQQAIRILVLIVMYILSLLPTEVSGQHLTQTIRGNITDADNHTPLIGVRVVLLNNIPTIGAVTDHEGNFRLNAVPVGRASIEVSSVGYESSVVSNLVVNSGKEVVLQLTMQESVQKMTEVVITNDKAQGEAMNEMALLSARAVSAEETMRYAGGFNDPSRIVSNFAGVTSTQDGSNDVIVRGNSPKYVQWRLEGEPITNPNHFGDQSAVGGSISTLNNNILGNSDFFTGAFPAAYGNALSGVYDVRFRPGNNEKMEGVAGIGLLGTDLTVEGPFKKGYSGSYLVNYRYSTAALLNALGALPISAVPKFQDASFKTVLPTKRAGIFSVFGLGGQSSISFKDVTPRVWDLPGDRFMLPGIKEDFIKKAHLLNTGLTHSYLINEGIYVKSSLSYSNDGIKDEVTEYSDSLDLRRTNFRGDIARSAMRASVTVYHKINAKLKFESGTRLLINQLDFRQSQIQDSANQLRTVVDFDERIASINSFTSAKYRPNERLTLVAGLHNTYVHFNKKATLEPRFAINWSLGRAGALSAGYGNHSAMEAVHHYFARVTLPDGRVTEPNRDLGLLRAHHYVIGYEKTLLSAVRIKMEAYYQDLYQLPVENDPNSLFATINEGLEFRYVDLVNAGTGKNYGLELTVERFFKNGYYFLVNGSIYQSKYTALDGRERNTQYNGEYLANILLGKEISGLGRKNNQILGINVKAFFGGGRKIIPLLRDANGNLAVDVQNNQFYDFSRAYENSIDDPYQIVLAISYKWNKAKTTQELFVNLDNITNQKRRILEYYDETQPGKVGYQSQFGLFPNMMYRVYF